MVLFASLISDHCDSTSLWQITPVLTASKEGHTMFLLARTFYPGPFTAELCATATKKPRAWRLRNDVNFLSQVPTCKPISQRLAKLTFRAVEKGRVEKTTSSLQCILEEFSVGYFTVQLFTKAIGVAGTQSDER